MPKMIDETNNVYDNFKVIGIDTTNNTQRKKWLCECQNCHSITAIYGTTLRSGKIPKCQQCEENKLNGKQFSKFTVISYAYTAKDRHKYYKCQCACGNIETVKGSALTTGQRTQCLECNKQERKVQYINEMGNHYGKLTVIDKYQHPTDTKNTWWLCKCQCGNVIPVKGIKLRSGHTQSCGCLKSKGEEKINEILTANNIIYKTQVSFPDCVDQRPLKFDFAIYDKDNNLSYLIEYDGEQHFSPVDYFGGQNSFDIRQKRDQIKNLYCQNHHIPLLRIPYTKLATLTINDLLMKAGNK